MVATLPVVLNLDGVTCLVVGGGEVATRKVEDLLAAGAMVRAVAPKISSRIWGLFGENQGLLSLVERPFADADLEGVGLVFSAAGDEAVNARVASLCAERGILVNVVDDPEKCTFFMPAVLRRGGLTIAVSTDGKSPFLARQIRDEVGEMYGDEYSLYVEILGEAREKIKELYPESEKRKKLLRRLVDGPLLEIIRSYGRDAAREWVRTCISLSVD